jgi:hypothetical protein
MFVSRTLALAVAIALTLTGGSGCSQPAPVSSSNGTHESSKNNAPPTPAWDDSYGGATDVEIYFLPVGPKDAGRRPALEVWRALFAGMAPDPDTKTLLRRLYNDLPVELVVVPAQAAKDKGAMDRVAAPPRPDFAVVLRVAAEPDLHEVRGGDRVGSLGCRRDTRVKRGEKSTDFVRLDNDGNIADSVRPDDTAILLLVTNDYLLRTKAGYCAFQGTADSQIIRSKFPTLDLEAMRANLDQQIADYLKRYQAPHK